MGFKRTILCAGLMAAALPASAAFTLDFEGIADSAAINGFYNGGTDSAGNSGTNYGVLFGSNALAAIDKDAGGSGNFENEPSPSTALFFLTGSAVLNYAPGFAGGFSFYYSSTKDAVVNVYDGLNATGNVVGSIQLDAQYNKGCTGGADNTFCNWSLAGVTFSSLAKSIDFGGTVNQIGYDNMKFGVDTPPGPVIPPITDVPGPITPPGGGNGGGVVNPIPEPSTYALMLLGLATIAFVARRRKQRA
jgi:PEP-CTERM motif